MLNVSSRGFAAQREEGWNGAPSLTLRARVECTEMAVRGKRENFAIAGNEHSIFQPGRRDDEPVSGIFVRLSVANADPIRKAARLDRYPRTY